MYNILSIIDVSPYIYTGQHAQNFGNTSRHNFPIKGVTYFLKHLCRRLSEGSDIILCFDSRSNRKALDSVYKSNRTPNTQVYAQLDFLYEFLPRYGFTCVKMENYEADDLVFTMVEKYKNSYKQVNVYTSDYDLAHNVSDNVSCLAINSTTIDVNIKTFPYIFGDDVYIPYNTISAYKLFMGDSSDNISAFSSSMGSSKEFYNLFLEVLNHLGDYNPDNVKTEAFMERFIDDILAQSLPEKEIKTLKHRLKLIYPQLVDYPFDDTPCNINSISFFEFSRLLNSVGGVLNAEFINSMVKDVNPSIIEYFKDCGERLKLGYYAIDDDVAECCTKMDLDSFTLKGF